MLRDDMLAHLHQDKLWDIIIIGGGATGLGCALDAANRGYSTLLLEQGDFAQGTSSRSTKLVHGGVRYLAQGNIKLVREALRERAYLLRNAPHVTKKMAFVIPCYTRWSLFFYGVGLMVYQFMAGTLSLGRTQILSKTKTLQHLPDIQNRNLKGGVLYYDGQFDDARLAIDIATTAVKYGAILLNYCCVVQLKNERERISKVVFTDRINGTTYNVKAKTVINATGVFADGVMEMDNPQHAVLIAPSQGIHLVVDQTFFSGDEALMVPKTDDGRVLFAVPWHEKVLLGTTDTPVQNISLEPKPMDEEIYFILHHANRYLVKNITATDVKSVFVGLRPLIKGNKKSTSLLSRDHTLIVGKSGLITISGGKWTTYRKMAEDAVNKAIVIGKLPRKPCKTKNVKIESVFIQSTDEQWLHPLFPFSKSDIICFVEKEMAQTVADILARRTRILFLDAKLSIEIAPVIATLLSEILQKDNAWVEKQIESFTLLANQYLVS